MEYTFVVSLRGEGVWHNCQLHFGISDTNEETLEKVRQKIAKDCNLEVYEFSCNVFGIYEAWTSREDVRVYIECIKIETL